jgi:hypothetical protein
MSALHEALKGGTYITPQIAGMETSSTRPGIGSSEVAPVLRKAQRTLSSFASQLSYLPKL